MIIASLTVVLAGCGTAEDVRTLQGVPSESPAVPSETPEVIAKKPAYRLVPPADPAALTIPSTSYYGWALLDRHTGTITGSPNAASEGNTVESMIKPWIVSDYLRRMAENGQTPPSEALDQLTLVIIDSNDPLAHLYYVRGGEDDVVQRLIDICGLTDVRIYSGEWWSTWMTPVDAVRYGQCLADGRAAGPVWTPWVLQVMTEVRGSVDEQISGEVQGGRWGIIDGLPPELSAELSFKNGFTEYVDGWHVNCLAIHADWILAVMMRSWAGLSGAADGCALVARSLVQENSG
ncbi:MAG: hypothetical protein IRY85_10505 [Micromonosporaceae bacterium]|nr:hypothetical protein [Micromonosporaceae bacterium]